MWIVRALMLGLVVAAAGCGGSDAEEARPAASTSGATTATAAPCGEAGVVAVTFTTPGGSEVDAAVVGDGEVGVVLGHQFRSNFCSWVPFAKELAERHMRSLALNFVSTSPDDDAASRRSAGSASVSHIQAWRAWPCAGLTG